MLVIHNCIMATNAMQTNYTYKVYIRTLHSTAEKNIEVYFISTKADMKDTYNHLQGPILHSTCSFVPHLSAGNVTSGKTEWAVTQGTNPLHC